MYAAYVELQLIAEKFLILLNLSNTHWIVVTLSTQSLSYFLGSEPISFSTTHCTRLGDWTKSCLIFCTTFWMFRFFIRTESKNKNVPCSAHSWFSLLLSQHHDVLLSIQRWTSKSFSTSPFHCWGVQSPLSSYTPELTTQHLKSTKTTHQK